MYAFMKRVAVIGAGASGLMAAYAAASGGAAVTVFEKNEKAGKKIYITGKGRCNVTNDCSPETFLENVVRGEKFLIGAAHAFPPAKTMRFLEENGLPLKVERGNRVFPLSEKASDVTKCFENCCRRAGVRFLFGTCVEEIEKSNGGWSLIANKKRYEADAVIVCTGGVSYPATGSTGDGYRFAKQLGLEVTPLRPSLCGIVCKADWLPQVQGLTLKNVELTAFAGPKKIASFFGEMLFTHFGVSGPIVLSLSALLNRKELSDVSLSIDLKPALTAEMLDKRLLRDFNEAKNKYMRGALCNLLPKSLIEPVLLVAGIPSEMPVHSLTRAQRETLRKTLKGLPLQCVSLRPIEEAVVTSGGVAVKQIDPKTMQCKAYPGLYFCGETLDADAYTGGFNLQIAFMTGYIAGKSSAV